MSKETVSPALLAYLQVLNEWLYQRFAVGPLSDDIEEKFAVAANDCREAMTQEDQDRIGLHQIALEVHYKTQLQEHPLTLIKAILPQALPRSNGSAVDHPKHYNSHASGVEAVDLIERLDFNVGSALKYLWRADHKGAAVQDLEKAAWYFQRAIDHGTFRLPAREHYERVLALVDRVVSAAPQSVLASALVSLLVVGRDPHSGLGGALAAVKLEIADKKRSV